MKWADALKEFAKISGKFVVPKKGSAEYEMVRAIMEERPVFDNSTKNIPNPDYKGNKPLFSLKSLEDAKVEVVKNPRMRKVRAPRAEKEGEEHHRMTGAKVDAALAERRRRAVKPTKYDEFAKKSGRSFDLGLDMEKAKKGLFDMSKIVSKARRAPKKAEADMIAKSEGKTKIDVARSANPEVLMNIATNVHEPVAPPAALGGDVKALKKSMARVRKPKALPKLVEPEHVKNEAPFSIITLKRKLGA